MSSAATRREQTSPCTSSAGRFVGERLPLRSTQRVQALATASDATTKEAEVEKVSGPPQDGPMKEYDDRVQEGRLRDDPYQRGKSDMRNQNTSAVNALVKDFGLI